MVDNNNGQANNKKPLNSNLSATGTTIFTVMSKLAVEHNAVNLGQGFPDTDGPQDIIVAAADTLTKHHNQYPPLTGLPELRAAVADTNKRFYGLDIDPNREVVVTSGATEALAASLMALVNPGDEIILLEPCYDTYLPMLKALGAVPKFVRLDPPHWDLPKEELAAAFGEKTKAILLNTPMNPTGKVFTVPELDFIGTLLKRHNAYAICDEVYEHLIYDNRKHIPLMALPGLKSHALRIGSAGKTFSLTGWKVGYVTAPAEIADIVAKAHQTLMFSTPPNLQRAVALGLRKDDSYFADLAQGLAARRDRLAEGLSGVGMNVLPSYGGYFLTVDFSPLGFKGDDKAFCRHITEKAGVTAIPVSAFYGGTTAPTNLARFAFCKREEVLDEAIKRLVNYFGVATAPESRVRLPRGELRQEIK